MDRRFHKALSLIIPAYNEAAGIQTAIAEADEALAGLVRCHEIIIVDDGSGDRTADAVRATLERYPAVRLIRHPRNRGYGAALRSGFEAARHDLVAFTDADCQFDLTDLGALLEGADTSPIVVGYRRNRQDPIRRRFLSWGYNQLVRFLLGTGVRDCDCALKVFHREVVLQLLPESTDYFVNTEMLARARRLGLTITEVGVGHRPRRHGSSKVSLVEVPRTFSTLMAFWWASARARHSSPAPTTKAFADSDMLPLNS